MRKYLAQLATIIKKEFKVNTSSQHDIFCTPTCLGCGTADGCSKLVFSEELYWNCKRKPNGFVLFDFIDKQAGEYVFGECKRLYPDNTDIRFISNLSKLQSRMKQYRIKGRKCKFVVITANSKQHKNIDAIEHIKEKMLAIQTVAPIDFKDIELMLCSDIMCSDNS